MTFREKSTDMSSLLDLRGLVVNVDDKSFTVYSIRWLILLLFVISGVANATILLSWAPITDEAKLYFDDIGITWINLLNVIFQITYLPGTLIALNISERYSLRAVMLGGGLITTFGCCLRLLGVFLITDKDISGKGGYAIVLLGTAFVGLAQPFYINLPARIAATWFAVDERDIAMTIASLNNPLGSAVGSFIPALFVASYTDDTDDADSSGILNLVLTQFIFVLVSFLSVGLLFQNEPLMAPSKSAHIMREQAKKVTEQRTTATPNADNGEEQVSSTSSEIFKYIAKLFENREYVKLFFSFSIVLGNLNALAALLNQLPGGYSSSQIGLTGAVLIMSGFFGAFGTGFVLDWSKKYRLVVKISYSLTFIFWIFFLSNCRGNNFALFIVGAALLGLGTLPTIPATIVSTVECSYPVPEDLSVGLLYVGANLTAIVMTFTGQVLLSSDSNLPSPLFPYGIFVALTMALALVPISTFKGKHLRLLQDRLLPTESKDSENGSMDWLRGS
jgi:FLVCR family MFS transporter 7